jgi:hypothetical protein
MRNGGWTTQPERDAIAATPGAGGKLPGRLRGMADMDARDVLRAAAHSIEQLGRSRPLALRSSLPSGSLPYVAVCRDHALATLSGGGPTPRASATRVIAAATAATTRSLAHLVPFLLQGLLVAAAVERKLLERLLDPVGSLPPKEALPMKSGKVFSIETTTRRNLNLNFAPSAPTP